MAREVKQEVLITRNSWQTEVALMEEGRLVEYRQEPLHLDGLVGNLYVGKIKRIMAGVQSAFVDIGMDRDGFLCESDIGPTEAADRGSRGGGAARKISSLREGDNILVQVAKESLGAKGPRLSSQISLPGKYVILLPYVQHTGVSRKIDGKERARLKAVAHSLVRVCGEGVILRTSAKGVPEAELLSEMQELLELWSLIRLRSRSCQAPELIHQEADLIDWTMREILLKGDGVVVTDRPAIAARCREAIVSSKVGEERVMLRSDRRRSLFERYGVGEELEKALRPRVWLASGGCIVIQSTEALVAIDVNSGRYAEKRSLEETAFSINMEAAEEITRQIRLRGLGGIIIIDFIDMTKKAHREALFEKLSRLFSLDRSKTCILNISAFGLVQMTRKRSHRNLERIMTGTCPCCDGRGRIAAPWRITQQVAHAVEGNPSLRQGMVRVSPEVLRFINDNRERFDFPETMRFEEMSLPRPAKFDLVSDRKENRSR